MVSLQSSGDQPKRLQTTADFRLGRQSHWPSPQPAVKGTVSGVPTNRQAQVKAPGFSGIVTTVVPAFRQQLNATTFPHWTIDSATSRFTGHRPIFSVHLFRLNLICPFCASARPRVACSGSALTPPLHLTFYGLFLQGPGDEELPGRAAVRPSLRLSQVDAVLPLGPALGPGRLLGLGPRAHSRDRRRT